jgi:hypothetical protein
METSPSYSTTPAVKRLPTASRNFIQAPGILRHDGSRQLDFDPGDLSAGAFEDGIDFGALLGPEMMQLDPLRAPACLPPEFLDHPGLEQVAGQDPIPAERLDGMVQNGAGNACIPEVELRRLDQAAEPVAVPRGQPLEQEDLLEQRHVVTERRPAQAERTGEFGQIEQPSGPGRGQRDDLRQDLDLPDAREVLDVPPGEWPPLRRESKGDRAPRTGPGLQSTSAQTQRSTVILWVTSLPG